MKSAILDNTKQINFITSLYAYNNKCPILSIKSNYIIDKSKYNILPYTCKKYNYWESKPIITSHKFIMGTNLYKYNSKYIYFDQVL